MHTRQIELIARGLILHRSRALMCRSVAGGHYYLPGGHIEFAEPASYALQREFLEEMGVPIRVGPLLLTAENTFSDGREDHHEITLVFHVEHLAGTIQTSDEPPNIASLEPGIEFEWVDLAAASDLDIRPLQIKAWLVSGGSISSPLSSGGDLGIPIAPHLVGCELTPPPFPEAAAPTAS